MVNNKVLVIDDEAPILESIHKDINGKRYEVFSAMNGEDGLEKYKKVRPILIILDLRMPGMDGIEFLEQIKVKPFDPYTIIVLTGHGNDEDVKKCFDLGVSSFIRKPYNINILRGTVRNCVNLKQMQQSMINEISERKQMGKSLKIREFQQATIREIGLYALNSDLLELMNVIVIKIAKTLNVEYSKVLELLPDRDALLLRAGVGWKEGLVGNEIVGTGVDSQAGYTLFSREPVIVKDLRREKRFSGPSLLKVHGIVSGMSVIILGKDRPFGVLGVHTTHRRIFTQDDINFLQATANILAEAIERKQAEGQIHKLSRVIEHSPCTVMITDINGCIEYVNPRFKQLTGYSLEEAIGQNPRILKSGKTPREEYERLWKNITSGAEWQGELCNKKKNGELYWELATIYPIKNNDGIITHMAAVKEEITERKKMEEELVKARKLESLGIFAGGIAHDFNNGLQGILSNITLAKKGIKLNDKIYWNLVEAEKAAFKAKDLTQQLLTFSKGGEPIKETISISELIKGSTNITLSGSNVKCEFDLPDDLCPIEADKGQLVQVFNNLIINAVQAMPKGGTIKIKVENIDTQRECDCPLEEGVCLKIIIEDHGIGISQEHLKKIFDPYFTTKGQGGGLGLSISYSIIKKHGGHIYVKSEIGVGTTLYIYLPVSQKEIMGKPFLREIKDKKSEKTTITGVKKILFMEDDAIISLSVTQELRNLEYEVKTTRDGAKAIKLYESAMEEGKPFDVVILDLMIAGGMGGEETIKGLLEINPNVRAIVASGYFSEPVMANYEKYGFKAVVPKPYEIYELEEAIHKAIIGPD